jgi:hypothetical protein
MWILRHAPRRLLTNCSQSWCGFDSDREVEKNKNTRAFSFGRILNFELKSMMKEEFKERKRKKES